MTDRVDPPPDDQPAWRVAAQLANARRKKQQAAISDTVLRIVTEDHAPANEKPKEKQ